MKKTRNGTEIRIETWSPDKPSRTVRQFLERPSIDARADATARAALSEIRERGEAAVLEYVAKYDGVSLTAKQLPVTQAELDQSVRDVDASFKRAVREAEKRISDFAKAGMKRSWRQKTALGGQLGEKMTPFDRVGVYIPGGSAPLASTVMMTVIPARVAGVREIAACTPARRDGSVNPYLLYALRQAGATEVYRVGGIQAIGLMAYGAGRIRKVQKIVGPGGPFVTAAKRAVYGDVALDMVAGPSEIAVLADEEANPAYVAADLLSQAEHGSGLEKSLLVTSSRKLAERVQKEMLRQTEQLSRRDLIRRVLVSGTLIVVVNNLEDGMALCNDFAPEHFELLVKNPRRWVDRVRAAGAIFIGPWTPESAGDFVAGPSHVLPTGGTARMFSGLTADDFLRRSSVVELSRSELKTLLPAIEAFGRVEGLDGHARSASIRFQKG